MLRVENENSHPENKEPNPGVLTRAKLSLTSVGVFPEKGLHGLPQIYNKELSTIGYR